MGVCLVGSPSKELKPEKCTDPKLIQIFEFITGLAKEVEFGDPADVVDINILSVDGRLRGKGVGARLYQHSEQTARSKSVKVAIPYSNYWRLELLCVKTKPERGFQGNLFKSPIDWIPDYQIK